MWWPCSRRRIFQEAIDKKRTWTNKRSNWVRVKKKLGWFLVSFIISPSSQCSSFSHSLTRFRLNDDDKGESPQKLSISIQTPEDRKKCAKRNLPNTFWLKLMINKKLITIAMVLVQMDCCRYSAIRFIFAQLFVHRLCVFYSFSVSSVSIGRYFVHTTVACYSQSFCLFNFCFFSCVLCLQYWSCVVFVFWLEFLLFLCSAASIFDVVFAHQTNPNRCSSMDRPK